ncbi:prolyl endopeptidase [Folsomia candida]|nr:prolyl endopeptidase [Folsomia candida]
MKKGSRLFYWENCLQNHNTLHVNESTDGSGVVRKILDPNLWDKDGRFSVGAFAISQDGKLVAYSISENGSDWETIKIREVDCGHDLEDIVRFTKLTNLRWTSDSKGFFYQRFPKHKSGYGQANGTETGRNLNAKLYYHVVDTLQDDDILVAEFPSNPTWTMFTELSDDGDYLFVHASDVIGEKYLFYASLKGGITGKLQLTRVFSQPGNHWYLANDDTVVYLMTTVGAKNFHHLIRVDLANHGKGKYDVIMMDQGKKVLWAIVVNENKLVICYVKDVLSRIEIRDLRTGNVIDQLAIEPGTASDKYGRRSDKEFYFKLESYVNPGTIYKVEFGITEIKLQVYKTTDFKTLDLDTFKMSMFSYSSNDGTNIPMFLVHKKNMPRDSNRPCLLTAYGGYGYSRLPAFNIPYLFFAQHFGVVAIANIRGGGEYGKNWHDEGRLLNKKTGFEDFIAGAKFLLNNGYTRPHKLAITGASNGGLLIGAVVNQRPDLFGAAIPQVGIMDMLRYHKFTVGHLWIGEFGSPDDSKYFHYLRQYSPLHNIKAPEDEGQQYPSILVTTSDHDDRVVCSHSLKYIAELQYMAAKNNPGQKNPFLLKVYQNTGHVSGKPTQAKVEEWTDIFAFLTHTLGYNFNTNP